MIKKLAILFLIIIQLESFGQLDSTWNLMLLKKGEQIVFKDNMADYSSSGFYLYRNCFYDLKLKDNTKQTLRLVDIKPDTLVFIGISPKRDTNLSITSNDTTWLNYNSISDILLLKSGMGKANKKIKCEDYHFLFYKSAETNSLESKYAYVFSSRDEKNELVPRLNSHGVVYYFEYGGALYYHSGINVKTPKYSDDEKVKALNAIMIALDLIVYKRLNVTIQNNKAKPDE
ncbi:MAG: hypothetical protein Q8S18_08910 [Bacteroidales bacterium]|nr:hypothetical protein [Bacteroidales bacterium]